jgi:hypothetical protein
LLRSRYGAPSVRLEQSGPNTFRSQQIQEM